MKPNPIPSLRRQIGERAFAATLAALPTTKTDAAAVARKWLRKGATIKATAAAMLTVATTIWHVRNNPRRHGWRAPLNADYHNSNTLGEIVSSPIYQARPILLPAKPLPDRLAAYRAAKWKAATQPLASALDRALGYVAHSAGAAVLTALPPGAEIAQVTASVASYDMGRYSASCTFRKISRQAVAKVPADWPQTVGAAGLACVHDLPTLAAIKADTDRPGEEVWRAVWARKTAGAAFAVESGYLVRRGAEITHGKTLATARANLTRRENESQLDRVESAILARLQTGQLNGASELTVTINDSTNAGNCRPGTLAFRDRHFPGRESATVREVLAAAESLTDRRFAVAACVRALRRQAYVPA